jgi:hypothetical protein
MTDLYEDLEKIYNKLNERLDVINNNHAEITEQEKLISWIKETLDEIKICLQAIAENRLCENSLTCR